LYFRRQEKSANFYVTLMDFCRPTDIAIAKVNRSHTLSFSWHVTYTVTAIATTTTTSTTTITALGFCLTDLFVNIFFVYIW